MRVNTGYMTETPPEVHLYEDAVEFMYLVLTRTPGRGLCTLYLHACQVTVTVADSGLCCTSVTSATYQVSNAN